VSSEQERKVTSLKHRLKTLVDGTGQMDVGLSNLQIRVRTNMLEAEILLLEQEIVPAMQGGAGFRGSGVHRISDPGVRLPAQQSSRTDEASHLEYAAQFFNQMTDQLQPSTRCFEQDQGCDECVTPVLTPVDNDAVLEVVRWLSMDESPQADSETMNDRCDRMLDHLDLVSNSVPLGSLRLGSSATDAGVPAAKQRRASCSKSQWEWESLLFY